MLTLNECISRDEADPLRGYRDRFLLNDAEIYLDGNSLGALPRGTAAHVQNAIQQQWGEGLVRSWNTAGWIELPQTLGNMIAPLIGAHTGEVVVADSTSVNLFKVLSAAAALVQKDAPTRNRIISERHNFPTDLYIAESVANRAGMELILLDESEILGALDERVAIVMLTHVNYRSGHMHDMHALTQAAHHAGALVVWDLAHSAGAVPVDLTGAHADFAVGCGYKYLNGGPGAPAFVWAHPRHTDRFQQPLSGWMGHAAPFEFTPHYRPGAGMARYLCGTPAILSMAALEGGLSIFSDVARSGGMRALRAKSLALTDLFISLMTEIAHTHGLSLMTPLEQAHRGSHVSYAAPEGAYAMIQALIARGVIGDFRAPDVLRFGFTPLYTRYADVWRAVQAIEQVLVHSEWKAPTFQIRSTVT